MESRNCAISVIVPVYNTKVKMLEDCVNSILSQDFHDFEVIIVDDGSNQDTAKRIDQLGMLDHRICIIHQDNKGVSVARNVAMKMATGEYICFVDADDKVVPFFLSDSYTIAKANKADFVIGTVYRTSDMNTVVVKKKSTTIDVFNKDDISLFRPYLLGMKYDLKNGDGGINRGPVAKLVRSEIAKKICFPPDMKIGEDGLWILSVLNSSSVLCFVPQIWYLYRRNPESATCKYNPDIIKELELYFKRTINYIDLNNENDYYGYVARIFELLKLFVLRSFLNHPECKLSVKERKTIENYLYDMEPWKLISDTKFRKRLNAKNYILATLYKYKLLFWIMRVIRKK